MWYRSRVFSLFWVLLISQPIFAFEPDDDPSGSGRRCAECHLCQVPTMQDTCLRATVDVSDPAFRHVRHSVTEAPDSVVLDLLVSTQAPVCFKHRDHAGMSEMGSGCTTCHHYSPEGEIPPCSQCHPPDVVAADAEELPLDEAYHRQCRSCHEDWSNDHTCRPCHLAHADPGEQSAHMPVSKTYSAPMGDDSLVTFQHIEHTGLFEFACTDCHRQESCKDCHGACRTGSALTADDDVQATCRCCHRTVGQSKVDETCTRCHHDEAQPPLFHQIVGQDVPDQFQGVQCKTCHSH